MFAFYRGVGYGLLLGVPIWALIAVYLITHL